MYLYHIVHGTCIYNTNKFFKKIKIKKTSPPGDNMIHICFGNFTYVHRSFEDLQKKLHYYLSFILKYVTHIFKNIKLEVNRFSFSIFLRKKFFFFFHCCCGKKKGGLFAFRKEKESSKLTSPEVFLFFFKIKKHKELS